mgnify:CR=1 FL=1
MMEKKDVLECCRSWNKPLNDVDDFLQSWLTHDNAQALYDRNLFDFVAQWESDQQQPLLNEEGWTMNNNPCSTRKK